MSPHRKSLGRLIFPYTLPTPTISQSFQTDDTDVKLCNALSSSLPALVRLFGIKAPSTLSDGFHFLESGIMSSGNLNPEYRVVRLNVFCCRLPMNLPTSKPIISSTFQIIAFILPFGFSHLAKILIDFA